MPANLLPSYTPSSIICALLQNRFYSNEHESQQPSDLIDLLHAQVLSRPLYVVVRKRSHEIVAVVVVGLHAQVDTLVVTSLLSRLDQVLRKELTLLVEVVASALFAVSKIPSLKQPLMGYAPHR